MERPAHLTSALGFASIVLLAFDPGLEEWHLVWGWLFAGVAGVFPDNDVKFGVHRKTLHNVFVLALTSIAAGFVGGFLLGPQGALVAGLAWMAGMLSHLLLDSLTVYGVAWLYPLKRETFGLRIARFNSVVWNKLFFILGVASSLSVALHVMGIPLLEQVQMVWRAFSSG